MALISSNAASELSYSGRIRSVVEPFDISIDRCSLLIQMVSRDKIIPCITVEIS